MLDYHLSAPVVVAYLRLVSTVLLPLPLRVQQRPQPMPSRVEERSQLLQSRVEHQLPPPRFGDWPSDSGTGSPLASGSLAHLVSHPYHRHHHHHHHH
uniref:Putative secreted protein n=1 Tax=Anopheles darlingi TaxID=43151 RepID=A0A2M4DGB7_ANODA